MRPNAQIVWRFEFKKQSLSDGEEKGGQLPSIEVQLPRTFEECACCGSPKGGYEPFQDRFKLNGVVLLKTSIEVKEMKATEKVAKHFSVYCTDEKLVKTLRSLSTQIEPRAREKCSSASSSVSVRDSIEQLASVVEGNKSSMENLVSKVEDLSRRHDSLNERYTEMSRENERSNREFSTQLTRVGFGCTTLRTDIQKANTKIKQHRVTTKEYI